MIDLDPFALAARQVALDRANTTRLPALFERKRARLAASPHAFLRGSAPLFYEILAARPDLAAGPAGEGFIVGDMHLENVGAYRDDADEVVFELNDFDDTAVAPLRLDVLRLSTSVLLAGRGFRATGGQAIALVQRMIGAYLKAVAGGPTPPEPALLSELVARVKGRSNKALVDDRAPLDAHGERRFLRGDRYLDLPPDIEARVPALLAAYVAALGDRAPGKASDWKVVDAALRIAGNGSLGVLRVAILVEAHGGDERLVELKQARPSSTEALVPPPASAEDPAAQVVKGARALLVSPPRHLCALHLDSLSFIGRRLFPQEDKLDLTAVHTGAALEALVSFIGHLLGAAHVRGATAVGARAPSPWSGAEVDAVVDHAVALAGMLEGIYLAWVRRASST
jgi:uncharacterized protein (DUF2252 family)